MVTWSGSPSSYGIASKSKIAGISKETVYEVEEELISSTGASLAYTTCSSLNENDLDAGCEI